jgi:hypothetical protein
MNREADQTEKTTPPATFEQVKEALENLYEMGKISPPIQVQRLRDGYVLMDRLYHLEATQMLGWERIGAIVEG